MNSFLIAFGIASIMLCIGTFLRAKIGFLRNMLVPASVIAGIVGCFFMNIVPSFGFEIGTDANMYTEIVNNLFTVSFISISLISSNGNEDSTAKSIFDFRFRTESMDLQSGCRDQFCGIGKSMRRQYLPSQVRLVPNQSH